MKLAKNMFIDGAWYGPDYGDEDLPAEVEAKIGQPAPVPGTVLAAQLRSRLLSAFGAAVDCEVVPAFAALSPEAQAEVLAERSDGDLVEMMFSELRLHVAAPVVLADDDTIVVAEGRSIRRGDLVAILDLLEETGAMDDPAATVETAQVLADPGTTTAIAEAEAEVAVPEGSVDDLHAWVFGPGGRRNPTDGWQQRAAAAVAVERAGESPRKGVLDLDQHIDDGDEVT